jgi:hypothetical protein
MCWTPFIAFIHLYHNVSKLGLLPSSAGKGWKEDPNLLDPFQRASRCLWNIRSIAVSNGPKAYVPSPHPPEENTDLLLEICSIEQFIVVHNVKYFGESTNYGTFHYKFSPASCYIFSVTSDTNILLSNVLQTLPIKKNVICY